MTAVVVCAGLVTLDLVHEVASVPAADEKIVGHAQRLEVGGPAANAARTIAALGLTARLIAPFGRSPFTALIAEGLRKEGVEWTDPVAGEPNPSPVSSVLISSGTGARAVISGGAPAVPGGWWDPQVLRGAGAVLVDGHGGSLPAVTAGRARDLGIPVVLDAGSYKSGMSDYLTMVDIALLSADFAAPGHSDPLAWCLSHGAGLAAASAGPGPLTVRSATDAWQVPVPGGPVVDTLGAGDVLHGALAAALAVGTPVDEAFRFSTSVATASVAWPGALGWAADPRTLARARAGLRTAPDDA